MNKAKLVFSKNGTSVHVGFSNGKESLEFETKEEALAAINDCYRHNKISKEEMEDLIKAVLLAKNFPEQDAETFIIVIALVSIDKNEDNEMITDPYVEMCHCGKLPPHAYVYDGSDKKNRIAIRCQIRRIFLC